MLTKNEFIKKLKEARACQLLIERRIKEILQDYHLNEVHFKAENSDNLAEGFGTIRNNTALKRTKLFDSVFHCSSSLKSGSSNNSGCSKTFPSHSNTLLM